MGQSDRKQKHTRFWNTFSMVLKRVALSLLLGLVLPTVFAADEKKPETPEATPAEEVVAGNEEDVLLDRHKRQVDTQVQRAANWVDRFFQEENYQAEGALPIRTPMLTDIRCPYVFANGPGVNGCITKSYPRFLLKMNLTTRPTRVSGCV